MQQLAIYALVAIGLFVGGVFAGRNYEADQCELALRRAAAELQRVKDDDAAQAAQAAAAAEAELQRQRAAAAQLEKEIARYASDQTRVRRQCFDSAGSLLWNRAAAGAAGVSGEHDGPVPGDVPDPAGGGRDGR